MNQLLLRNILLTIAYCDQFSYPLTLNEIYLRLLWNSLEKFPSKNTIKKVLTFLIKNGWVSKENDYYSLATSKKLSVVRNKRKILSNKKWQEASCAVSLLIKIPWVSGIAVTGALAMDNVIEDDDIDFLIVTKNNRLWLVRIFVILLAFLKGKRRSWQKEEENSWCFNLLLEEQSLQVPLESRTAYTAYELVQTQWMAGEVGVVDSYYRLNNWVNGLAPVIYQKVKKTNSQTFIQLPKDSISFPGLFSVANYVAYFFQRIYMAPHKTRESVGLSYAFFHPRDTKSLLYSRWKKSLLGLLQ